MDINQQLLQLFPNNVPAGARITALYTQPGGGPKKIRHYADIDSAADAIESAMPTQNVYIYPALRIEGLDNAHTGTNEQLVSTQAIYANVDYRGEGHAATDLPTRAELEEIIAKLPLEPSMLIDSSGGFYPVCQLDCALDLQQREDVEEAKCLFKLITNWLKTKHGVTHVESNHIGACWRLPGTLNFKRKPEGEMVQVVSGSKERYSVEQIKEAFTPSALQSMVQACGAFQDAIENPGRVGYNQWLAMRSNLACATDKAEAQKVWLDVSLLKADAKLYEIESQWEAAMRPENLGKPMNCRNITLTDGNPCPLMGVNGRCTLPGGGKSPAALMNHEAPLKPYELKVDEMNDHLAYLAGNNTGIMRTYFNTTTKREEVAIIKLNDVAQLYAKEGLIEAPNRMGEMVYKTPERLWLESPMRREFRNIVFEPAGGSPLDYNLWLGFAVEPNPFASCELFLAHLREVVCASDKVAADYLERWMAHAVQHPEELPGVAVALLSKAKGSGKNSFVEYFGEVFGKQHFVTVSKKKQLFGQFNAHLAQALLVHGEELMWGGDHEAENILKSMITTPYQTLESKGKDAITVRNYARFIFSSNNSWVVPASEDERRFFVQEVSSCWVRDYAYFKALGDERANGGPGALLHYLQHLDLAGFNVREVPNTEALAEQKVRSNQLARYLQERLSLGSWSDNQSKFYRKVKDDLWFDDFRRWRKDITNKNATVTKTEVLAELQTIIPDVELIRPRLGNNRPRVWAFPSHADCCEAF